MFSLAAFLLTAVGCSNQWLVWGNHEGRTGNANLFAYEDQDDRGGVILGLDCRSGYANDPGMAFEVFGTKRFTSNVAVVLSWHGQEAVWQEWKSDHRFTTATGNGASSTYWIYPPDTDTRVSFLAALTRSEHLAVELSDSHGNHGDVVRAKFETRGAGRTMEELSEFCSGKR